jgi:hypothetical protein
VNGSKLRAPRLDKPTSSGRAWDGYDGENHRSKTVRLVEPHRRTKAGKSKGTIRVIAQLKLFLDRHWFVREIPERDLFFAILSENRSTFDMLS